MHLVLGLGAVLCSLALLGLALMKVRSLADPLQDLGYSFVAPLALVSTSLMFIGFGFLLSHAVGNGGGGMTVFVVCLVVGLGVMEVLLRRLRRGRLPPHVASRTMRQAQPAAAE